MRRVRRWSRLRPCWSLKLTSRFESFQFWTRSAAASRACVATMLLGWQGVRPARTFAAACMQPPSSAALFPASLLMDEDCLYLNVFAPPTAASLPVIVFVHGGGLRRGFSSLRRYWGNNMAANMQAVVVTLDYRLGPLGFLVLGNLSRGHDGEVGPRNARS